MYALNLQLWNITNISELVHRELYKPTRWAKSGRKLVQLVPLHCLIIHRWMLRQLTCVDVMEHKLRILFIWVFNLPLEVAYYSSMVDDRNYFHILSPGADIRQCWVGMWRNWTKSGVSCTELYKHRVLSIEFSNWMSLS